MPSVNSNKNKCQFCVAYFADGTSYAEHSEKCFARLSVFLARDGAIKFACMVCRDVFSTPAQLGEHERMHRLPGGFSCVFCAAIFLCERDRVEHLETDHKTFECLRCDDGELIFTEAAYIQHCGQEHNSQSGYALCLACGATFEEKSHLRFHAETECGSSHGWTCIECAAILSTEDDLTEHSAGHSTSKIKMEHDDIDLQFEHVSSEGMGSSFECNDVDDVDDSGKIEESLFVENSRWKDEVIDNVKLEDAAVKENMETEANVSDDGDDSGDESESSGNSEEDIERPQTSRPATAVRTQHNDTTEGQIELNAEVKVKRGSIEHKCDKCEKVLPSKRKLAKHNRENHKCGQCGFTAVRSSELASHLKTECRGKPKYTCLACNEWLPTKPAFISHKKTHSVFKCAECVDKSFSTYRGLYKHSWLHMYVVKHKYIKCSICRDKFRTQKGLEKHKIIHGADGSKKFKCIRCPTFLTSKDERKQHIEETHADELKCADCINHCSNRDVFNAHINYDHLNLPRPKVNIRHTCAKCGISFAWKRRCEDHEKSNCDQDPLYKCEPCGKAYITAKSLQIHMLSHQDQDIVKKFVCSYCGKKWRTECGLKQHLVYHTGERRFACNLCDKRFLDWSGLKYHEPSHTGIKPYMCQCGLRFSCVSNLRKHRSTKQNKEKCGALPLIRKKFPSMADFEAAEGEDSSRSESKGE